MRWHGRILTQIADHKSTGSTSCCPGVTLLKRRNWDQSIKVGRVGRTVTLKAHLRRIGARTFTDIFNAIGEICDLYTPQECWNYFRAAGYVAS